MRVLLSCVFILFREVDLENISGTIRWNLTNFLNTLTAKGKNPIEDRENLPLPIQIPFSEKKKLFLKRFFHLWTLYQILNILKNKDGRRS